MNFEQIRDNFDIFSSLLKIFFDALGELSSRRLKDLAAGKLVIKFEYLQDEAKKAAPETPKQTPKVESVSDEVCKKVRDCSTREEAREYLESFNFKKSQLLGAAQYYNIVGVNKYSKSDLIDKIIEITVGSKLRFDAVLNFEESSQPVSKIESAPGEICENSGGAPGMPREYLEGFNLKSSAPRRTPIRRTSREFRVPQDRK